MGGSQHRKWPRKHHKWVGKTLDASTPASANRRSLNRWSIIEGSTLPLIKTLYTLNNPDLLQRLMWHSGKSGCANIHTSPNFKDRNHCTNLTGHRLRQILSRSHRHTGVWMKERIRYPETVQRQPAPTSTSLGNVAAEFPVTPTSRACLKLRCSRCYPMLLCGRDYDLVMLRGSSYEARAALSKRLSASTSRDRRPWSKFTSSSVRITYCLHHRAKA
jgi:hypothetical protein